MARKKNQDAWNCLSVRQPYAWAIIVGAKDVENRKRPSYYLGQLYIHAGLTEDVDAVEEITERVAAHLGISASAARARYRRHRERRLGAIIGSVQMFGCAVSYESEWFDGKPQYGYLLRDPVRLRQPIPAKGSTAIPFKFRP